jgi:hypothetical protein
VVLDRRQRWRRQTLRCHPLFACTIHPMRMLGCFLVVLAFVWSNKCVAQELRPLPYNHPGLVVDLGVGLWAWPIPCDADADGDFDLLVSCPDKPSNGVWFFENSGETKDSNGQPVFRPGKRLSPTVHYVMPSYVKGQVRVLSPGLEYTDFLTSSLLIPSSINHLENNPKVRESDITNGVTLIMTETVCLT